MSDKHKLSEYAKIKRNEEKHLSTIKLQAKLKISLPAEFIGTEVCFLVWIFTEKLKFDWFNYNFVVNGYSYNSFKIGQNKYVIADW